MAAVSDIQLLSQCAEFTLSHSSSVREKILNELQTNASTPLIMGLRLIRLQGVVLSIGMFSLLESLLQTHVGWSQPFDHLVKYLRDHEEGALADSFNDYWLAINVLKHGSGRSYDQLLAKSANLEFKVKSEGEPFFYEGDVSEVDVLIDVDETFVRRCAGLIEEVSSVIRSNEQVWI
ncbi:MAG TPA: hypothetical protein VEK82_11850 [Stellaceae bacterium]|nr:hypothetical protein [Stellaceae bacterium]